jgi:hypothetical protein
LCNGNTRDKTLFIRLHLAKEGRNTMSAENANQTNTGAGEATRRGSPTSSPLIVPITLRDYWYETISREEALRRLASRNLDPKTRTETEIRIPPQTQHFLTFHGGAFREYADFGDGAASVLLILPIIENYNGTKFKLVAPVCRSERQADGRIVQFSGIEFHQYEGINGTLFENGIPIKEFQFSQGPTGLHVDVSFVVSMKMRGTDDPGAVPNLLGGLSCCLNCEWLHSVLGIHNLDPICCLGTCGPLHIATEFF